MHDIANLPRSVCCQAEIVSGSSLWAYHLYTPTVLALREADTQNTMEPHCIRCCKACDTVRMTFER